MRGGRRERGGMEREESGEKNISVNVCWCILILRCTSKGHTPEKFCWCAPENTYTPKNQPAHPKPKLGHYNTLGRVVLEVHRHQS
jgi:hypothetical protein